MKWGRLTFFVIVLVLLCASLALANKKLNMREATSSPAMPGRAPVVHHWYIVVCSSQADEVSVQGGQDRNHNDVFGDWKQGDGTKAFAFPENYDNLMRVYVQVNVKGDHKPTAACVGYDGWAKKALSLDHGNWHGDVDIRDFDDNCACR